MKKNYYLFSHIYFGISVVSLIFLFFINTNMLFNMAYAPMTPANFGGKTAFCLLYLAIAIIIYCFLLLKKKFPIYIAAALLILFEIFNYIYPITSTNYTSSYISSLLDPNGNLFITIKASVLILIIIFSIIIFSVKNKYIKIMLRTLSVILPAAFLVFEFVILKNTDAVDILDFSEKLEMSLLFDFVRFTPITALSFLPSK